MTDAPALHLTIDEVAKWRRTLANNAAQIERLVAENQTLEARLEAVRTLAPNLFEGGVGDVGHKLAPDSLATWPELVFYALARANGGRSQAYMIEVGRSTSMAAKIENNPNGLYNAVQRMEGDYPLPSGILT
jgi:hypothetical protein